MSDTLPVGACIGILGGGQLGRMLSVAAARLGYRSHIFEPSANPPAADVAHALTTASYDDAAALTAFAETVDVITYEFENIPTAIYWAVITLASVGYGDISPVTPIGRAITVVMSLLGIGIFAIPAGLLASAFSDQLHKEREALKASILKMLGDGVLDPEEAALLRSEAKRLHLTVEEMNSILEVLQLEMENVRKSLLQLPVNVIAQNPLHAVEHYKYLLNQISQLGIYVDQKAFLEKAQSEDRLTVSELEMWKRIHEHR